VVSRWHIQAGSKGGEGTGDVVAKSPARDKGMADAGFKLIENSGGALEEGVKVNASMMSAVARGKEEVSVSPVFPGYV
jgi:hypothetical protein